MIPKSGNRFSDRIMRKEETGNHRMAANTQPRPITGRTVLVCTLAFFGVVLGVNLTMLKFAIDTMPGTEVDSAYRASLAFNSEIGAAREQASRGWQVTAQVHRDASGVGTVRVEARDRAGAPLSGLSFTAQLSRPTDKRADQALALSERAGGVYAARIDALAPGQWDLVLAAGRDGAREFLSRSRVVLQ
jgi:nitrogen fixation protein FixH